MPKKKKEKELSFDKLYTDEATGKRITTNSMLKTFRRCPKQAEYKYYRRLKPKFVGRPLTNGKWMHALLETKYKGEDWHETHRLWTNEYAKLFDEEKAMLGNLPVDIARMMRGYDWHYKHDTWKVLGVEQMVETELPDGSIFRLRYDMLIEDEFGLWAVDHKNQQRFPDHDFRLMDSQGLNYVWALRRSGVPVRGFIWNYIKAKPMTLPTPIQSGKRLSITSMRNCDYLTAREGIKRAGLDRADHEAWLQSLKNQRFRHGMPQTSEFFQRRVLERDDAVLDRYIKETFHTHLRMHDYNFVETDTVERVPDRSCSFMCSYKNLCSVELFGGNTDLILRKEMKEEDPMAYYFDEKPFGDDNGN